MGRRRPVSVYLLHGAVRVPARPRRFHAGDRGLIAAPWTRLAFPCYREVGSWH
jgi:hypothetical protein